MGALRKKRGDTLIIVTCGNHLVLTARGANLCLEECYYKKPDTIWRFGRADGGVQ